MGDGVVARVAFKQCDVERLLRAAKAVGYSNPTVEKMPDGRLRLLTDEPMAVAPANDVEDDLDDELEAWRRGNGDG